MSILSENYQDSTIGSTYELSVTVYDSEHWSADLVKNLNKNSQYFAGRLANVIVHKFEDFRLELLQKEILQTIFKEWWLGNDEFCVDITKDESGTFSKIGIGYIKSDGVKILAVDLYKR